jgi:hypothetical protein
MVIPKASLLEILEYCDKVSLVKREQYYIDTLKPKYNILENAYSSIGYKHKPEILEKVRKQLGELNKKKSIEVEVIDTKTNTTVIYSSIRKAAEALKTDTKSLLYNEKITKLFKNRYDIKIRRR